MYSGAWFFLMLVLIVSVGFINNTRKQGKCTGLSIDVNNESGNFFIDEDDVRAFVYTLNGDPIGQSISKMDIAALEKKLGQIDVVRNAEVYTNLKGQISIEIEQRVPIARVFFENGESVYMDDRGEVMPLSSKFTARLIVINGKVPIPILVENVEVEVNPEWQNLYALLTIIREDAFYKAQFEQIYINRKGEYEITPRVGRHSILLGNVENLNKKLRKLKLFYKEGISKVDWNKYKQIDLRFSDQIVCSKR
jgi:cell division protein FtsQ